MTSCSTDQGGDQEWRRWNANQAIHNSVEHCSLGLLSPFLKGVPTTLVEHCCRAACPVIVSLYKAGCRSLDHLKLIGHHSFTQVNLHSEKTTTLTVEEEPKAYDLPHCVFVVSY